MGKKKYLAAAVMMSCTIGMTAYAGDINENESAVIGAASGVFTYGGQQYVATSEAMGILYAKLCEDGIDLTAEQAAEAISLGYANIGVGVQMGYLVSIGPVETEPEEAETDPAEGETESQEMETDPAEKETENQESNPQSEQESEQNEKGKLESAAEDEINDENNQEIEQTGKQSFVDQLIKRMRKEKNLHEEEKEEKIEISASMNERESNFISEEEKTTVKAEEDSKEERVTEQEQITEIGLERISESNEQRIEDKVTEQDREQDNSLSKETQEIIDSREQKKEKKDFQEKVKKNEILI